MFKASQHSSLKVVPHALNVVPSSVPLISKSGVCLVLNCNFTLDCCQMLASVLLTQL